MTTVSTKLKPEGQYLLGSGGGGGVSKETKQIWHRLVKKKNITSFDDLTTFLFKLLLTCRRSAAWNLRSVSRNQSSLKKKSTADN